MYSYEPLHMAEQRQDNQLEPIYSSFVLIWDVALKTDQEQWTIEKSGEKGSGISMLMMRHDDDDEVLLSITNNSIKHQIFAYTQLNDQTVLLLTIQFSISHSNGN